MKKSQVCSSMSNSQEINTRPISCPVYVFSHFGKKELDLNFLVERLNLYGNHYRSRIQESQLVVLAGISIADYNHLDNLNLTGLRIIRISNPTKNAIFFAIRSIRQIRNLKIRPSILIAGDVYVSAIVCALMRYLTGVKRLKTQISIHGFYFDIFEASNTVVSRIKSYYLKQLVRRVNSIRVVSRELESDLVVNHKVDFRKVFVSPIPVSLDTNSVTDVRNVSVVFVGRLHSERGITRLQEVIRRSLEGDSSVSFQIIGDGPLRKGLQRSFFRHSSQVEFKGHIPHIEIIESLRNSSIVLSTAKSEGYGLAIREALSAGCFVLAFSNPLTESLQISFPKQVFTYKDISDAVDQINSLRKREIDAHSVEEFRQKQLFENNESLNNLIQSWV